MAGIVHDYVHGVNAPLWPNEQYGRSGRVAVPVADIRTISESHIDGTTLLRTSDGGTIAVEESFEKAVEMWKMAYEV